jgi:hypothetical protein
MSVGDAPGIIQVHKARVLLCQDEAALHAGPSQAANEVLSEDINAVTFPNRTCHYRGNVRQNGVFASQCRWFATTSPRTAEILRVQWTGKSANPGFLVGQINRKNAHSGDGRRNVLQRA